MTTNETTSEQDTATATQPQRSTNGDNGRGPGGRFVRGNPGGPGNPDAKKVASLRAAMLRAVTAGDVREIIKQLVTAAKDGDIQAAKLILDRVLGPPLPIDVEERLAKLEALLGNQTHELPEQTRKT